MAGRDARGRFSAAKAAAGSRSRLSDGFLEALSVDFAANGAKVIEALRAEKPADYLKLVLALQPKEARADGTFEDISDDELDKRIERLAAALGLELKGRGSGAEPSEA